MSKQKVNKVKNFLLVFLSIGLVISVSLLYQEKKENQSQYESLLNRFYIELSPTLDNINVLLSDEDIAEEEYTTRLNLLEVRLSKLNTILKLGDATLSSHIHDQPTFALYAEYESIEDIENKKDYFKGLKEVLLFVQKEMYSEETRQENPNLSVDEFNQIIDEGTDLYENLLGFTLNLN